MPRTKNQVCVVGFGICYNIMARKRDDPLFVVKEFRCYAYAGLMSLSLFLFVGAIGQMKTVWYRFVICFMIIGLAIIPTQVVLTYVPLSDEMEPSSWNSSVQLFFLYALFY